MPVPLIQLQQRNKQVGRIRLGEKVAMSGGKSRPGKLDRFRVTSGSERAIREVAAVYGGEAKTGGPDGWEVYTEAKELNIGIIPGRSISMYYELWGKKTPRAKGITCLRRCDGETELISGEDCLCAAAGTDDCKLKTRIGVIIADVGTLGLWRLDTGSWYAANELPADIAMIEQLAAMRPGDPVPATLRIEERKRQTEEGTKKFVVPVIDVNVSLQQIYASTGSALAPGTAIGQRSLASAVSPERPVAVLTAGGGDLSGPDSRATVDDALAALDAGRDTPLPRNARSAEPVGGHAVEPDPTPLPEEPEQVREIPPTRKTSGRTADDAQPAADDDEGKKKRTQRIVLAAKDAGVDRHEFVRAFTDGRTDSSTEITAEEFPTAMATLVQIKRGKVVLRDGALVNADLGIVHSPNPATADAILEDAADHDDVVAQVTEVFDGVEVDEDGSEVPEAEVVEDEPQEVWSAEQWKEWAPKGTGQATILRTARRIAEETGEDPPTQLGGISATVGAAVRRELQK